MKIGEKIKLYREAKGINKSELARIINVSPAYITKLEKGEKQNPSNEVILKIAAALDINPKDLLSNTEIQERVKETSRINELLQRELFKNDFDINLFDTRVMKYINDTKTWLEQNYPGVEFNSTLIMQNILIKIIAEQQAKEDTKMNTVELYDEYILDKNSLLTGDELYDQLYKNYFQKYKNERKRILGKKVSLFLECNEDYEYTEPEIRIIKEYYENFPKTDIPKRFIKYFDNKEK